MSSPIMKATYGDRVSMGNISYRREDVLSRGSVVDATLALLAACVLAGIATVMVGIYVSPNAAIMLNYLGIGGSLLATAMLIFSPKLRKGGALIGLFYAVMQGLMLGGFTYSIGSQDIKGVAGWNLVGQAIVGTAGLFFIALILYRTGAIRMSGKLTKFIVFATSAFGLLYLVNIGATAIFHKNLLMGSGPIPIVIGVAAIILGTLSLIKDFDDVDRLVEGGTPKEMKWSLATSLVSSLVWLYVELLRVLFLIQRN